MAKIHVVKESEHLSSIAAQFGFADFLLIWNHPDNAGLRALRDDPHVLAPGDKVFIPDRVDGVQAAETTQINSFEVDASSLFLRVKVHDLGNVPIADADCVLRIEFESEPKQSKTDKSGFVLEEIRKTTANVELLIDHKLPALKKGDAERTEQLKYDLRVGGLNPESQLSGQQARLNNMSYFAGFTTDDLEQMQWAIEEFQCDHMNAKPVKKTPIILPESDDPTANTGVQDAPTQKKIRELHGS
ncbi:MAG: hypothetical protein ACKVX7_17450 [Planctomycetota bacterium]